MGGDGTRTMNTGEARRGGTKHGYDGPHPHHRSQVRVMGRRCSNSGWSSGVLSHFTAS
jgi:hypothetical protein